MERWTGRVALVTGASAGIGAAIASRLVKHGLKVVGCARNVDRIKEFADKLKGEKGELYPIKCDLKNENEILAMFGEIQKKYGGLDICVNNAGLAHDAPLVTGEAEKWRDMLDINVLALSICTREALQLMKSNGVDDGHIVHVSSISGHIVGSRVSMYAASKYAVRALTDGLRSELRELNTHIRVSSVSPGVVETEFVERLYDKEKAEKLYSSMQTLTAEDITDAVIYAISSPPHVQVHDILVRPTEQRT